MGLGSFRWKLLLIVIIIIFLWQSSKIWLSFAQDHVTEEFLESEVRIIEKEVNAKEIVHITVYYETLCPDSRSFFVYHLLPTYMKLKENVQITLIPYGKATTTQKDHTYEFKCQHGPIECQGNIIHACAIDLIKDQSLLLNYLSCMIKNNIDPENIMEICAQKMNVDSNVISKCYSGAKGKELLAKYGELTSALKPRISFIPTISLNDSVKDQAKILKNLLQEVCLLFKIKPEGCL
ncbi:gamma-interferon-inducible lysosomal thiol reductase-like isoform X2 [Vespa mandarinia]|uniref:gamma-interferon-inducible lysosomal thiol reductase-like isoform X2 n=1 Tax=Vespa mandarinia TaxID=7446 RepID=UPI00160E2E73|nr:gamma-interferon-inducible lysosomal thiol reductase-like isoform X2 [Vespa mandarinia]